jgi:hypothetical protein
MSRVVTVIVRKLLNNLSLRINCEGFGVKRSILIYRSRGPFSIPDDTMFSEK